VLLRKARAFDKIDQNFTSFSEQKARDIARAFLVKILARTMDVVDIYARADSTTFNQHNG
jgi:hypothetical protein